ncbi:unnamed protein product, partial [Mesorhabditis belari]|uniref:Uncharacterized protein n=1 Tax=Mesorhabditis belari TaxID=2138241 RepID=A0AAF3EH27_9BILA
MIWLLTFVKLLAADSIILSNDCTTLAQTANCRIELETLKGIPGADCPLFSTVDRSCSVYGSAPETSTTSPNPGQETDHSVSENGEVTIVTFNASNANGSTSLHGETIWSRPPPGSIEIKSVAKSSLPDVGNLPKVVCLCTPSGIDLEAKPPTNQNLAAVLLSGDGNDGSQARLKRDQKEPDSEDDEQIGKHLTKIAEEASQNIQIELDKMEEKPRTKRDGPSSDSPFTTNNLYEDDIPSMLCLRRRKWLKIRELREREQRGQLPVVNFLRKL